MKFFCHHTAIIDKGAVIGKNTKIWHFSHVMNNSRIGEICVLGQNVMEAPRVTIGDNVKIQNNVSLYTGLYCEDDVFIGPSVVFTNVLNPRSFIERKNEFRKTILRKGSSIGANTTVVCGVEIGSYALVGAGSVIVKSVKEFAVVVGNPGKQIGWVSKAGMRLEFGEGIIAFCPETKEKYELKSGGERLVLSTK